MCNQHYGRKRKPRRRPKKSYGATVAGAVISALAGNPLPLFIGAVIDSNSDRRKKTAYNRARRNARRNARRRW